MSVMAELAHIGIAGTVTPVSPSQEAVLRRQGWVDVAPEVEPASDDEHDETPLADPGVTVDPDEDDVETSTLPPPPPPSGDTDQGEEPEPQES